MAYCVDGWSERHCEVACCLCSCAKRACIRRYLSSGAESKHAPPNESCCAGCTRRSVLLLTRPSVPCCYDCSCVDQQLAVMLGQKERPRDFWSECCSQEHAGDDFKDFPFALDVEAAPAPRPQAPQPDQTLRKGVDEKADEDEDEDNEEEEDDRALLAQHSARKVAMRLRRAMAAVLGARGAGLLELFAFAEGLKLLLFLLVAVMLLNSLDDEHSISCPDHCFPKADVPWTPLYRSFHALCVERVGCSWHAGQEFILAPNSEDWDTWVPSWEKDNSCSRYFWRDQIREHWNSTAPATLRLWYCAPSKDLAFYIGAFVFVYVLVWALQHVPPVPVWWTAVGDVRKLVIMGGIRPGRAPKLPSRALDWKRNMWYQGFGAVMDVICCVLVPSSAIGKDQRYTYAYATVGACCFSLIVKSLVLLDLHRAHRLLVIRRQWPVGDEQLQQLDEVAGNAGDSDGSDTEDTDSDSDDTDNDDEDQAQQRDRLMLRSLLEDMDVDRHRKARGARGRRPRDAPVAANTAADPKDPTTSV